jgi:hypothetical protein
VLAGLDPGGKGCDGGLVECGVELICWALGVEEVTEIDVFSLDALFLQSVSNIGSEQGVSNRRDVRCLAVNLS